MSRHIRHTHETHEDTPPSTGQSVCGPPPGRGLRKTTFRAAANTATLISFFRVCFVSPPEGGKTLKCWKRKEVILILPESGRFLLTRAGPCRAARQLAVPGASRVPSSGGRDAGDLGRDRAAEGAQPASPSLRPPTDHPRGQAGRPPSPANKQLAEGSPGAQVQAQGH